MEKMNEVKQLMVNAINEFYYAEKYCKSYMLKAQKLGLQGEKRRLRYESTKFHNLINFFECDFYDLYGIDITMQHGDNQMATVSSIQDFIRKVLEYKEKMFDKFHNLANGLVVANGRNYAGHLYKYCDCLVEDIKEYRRMVMEGDASGWSEAYLQRLMMHETTWHNVHDSFEDKEKSVGYDF